MTSEQVARLEELKTYGTLSQVQAQEYHKLLSLEDVLPVEPVKAEEEPKKKK